MPIGVARAIVAASKSVPFFINSPQGATNLRTYADAHGYSGTGGCTITIGAVAVGAITRGTWPALADIRLVVRTGGTVSGAGGTSNSGAGGPALDATSGPLTVDNHGIIRGGGGSGGVGGSESDAVNSDGSGGGGGGGGRGYTTAAGGPGANVFGNMGDTGSSGNAAGPGLGGVAHLSNSGAGPGGTGGTGGDWGTAGNTGGASVGNPGFTVTPPGAGGIAGKSVIGYSNVTWVNVGTLTGPTA